MDDGTHFRLGDALDEVLASLDHRDPRQIQADGSRQQQGYGNVCGSEGDPQPGS
jgi:hypothetical protein